MIERYTRPAMGSIWTEESKYRLEGRIGPNGAARPHLIVIGSEPRSRTRMEDFREEILARGHIRISA